MIASGRKDARVTASTSTLPPAVPAAISATACGAPSSLCVAPSCDCMGGTTVAVSICTPRPPSRPGVSGATGSRRATAIGPVPTSTGSTASVVAFPGSPARTCRSSAARSAPGAAEAAPSAAAAAAAMVRPVPLALFWCCLRSCAVEPAGVVGAVKSTEDSAPRGCVTSSRLQESASSAAGSVRVNAEGSGLPGVGGEVSGSVGGISGSVGREGVLASTGAPPSRVQRFCDALGVVACEGNWRRLTDGMLAMRWERDFMERKSAPVATLSPCHDCDGAATGLGYARAAPSIQRAEQLGDQLGWSNVVCAHSAWARTAAQLERACVLGRAG